MVSCSRRLSGPTMKRSATNMISHDANSAIMILSAWASPARANSITPAPNDSAKNEWNHHSRRKRRRSRDGGGAGGAGGVLASGLASDGTTIRFDCDAGRVRERPSGRGGDQLLE